MQSTPFARPEVRFAVGPTNPCGLAHQCITDTVIPVHRSCTALTRLCNRYFVPKTRSCIAVSAMLTAFTSLPLR
jgi:hypothetical protein